MPAAFHITNMALKRLAPACKRMTFFFFDKAAVNYLNREKGLTKTSFSFDGVTMLSLALSEAESMHPAFYRLSDVT